MVCNLEYLPGIGSSDHITMRFDLACYTSKNKDKNLKYNFWRADFALLNTLIEEIPWEVMDDLGVDECYAFFKATLQRLTDQCVPMARNSSRRKNLYMTSQAMNLRKKKRQQWHNYIRSQDIVDHARFTRCRNQLRGMTRRLRKEFERDLVSKIKEDPKQFWRYSNSRLKTKSRIEDLHDERGNVACDDADTVMVLNRFFSSVFTHEDLETVPAPPVIAVGPKLDTIHVTESMVKEKLDKLKASSSPGPDGIHPRILKESACSVSVALAKIFNISLCQGSLPVDWKGGAVVPIFKKGDKHEPSNYRPVSLTSIPCKILESIIRDELIRHLETSNWLTDDQHGFRQRRSCITQLLEVMEDWTGAMERGDPVDALYLDFQKAFDSVPHQRLLSKLSACGVSGRVFKWVQSFLTGRQQQVIIRGSSSPWSPVTSGVPQGSVLGPTLFILFINDLPEVLSSSVKMFADDTKIFYPVAHEEGRVRLQDDLDAALAWSDAWQLPFNEAKCKVLHLGGRNPEHNYTMRGAQLEKTHVEKDLGIYIDSDLKFRRQAASAASKATQILSLIRRSFELHDCVTLPLLYKSLVRPHLEYGNTIWGPFNHADQRTIEHVQRRATRLIPDIRNKPYAGCLHCSVAKLIFSYGV